MHSLSYRIMEWTLLFLIIPIHSFFYSFIHSFIHALASMLKTEMHFLKRFTQSAHLIFACISFRYFFILFQKCRTKMKNSDEKCRENHNTMVTIVICIIRTCVLRNERLFSGSSDSLNRALRPFPFEIRHMHTQRVNAHSVWSYRNCCHCHCRCRRRHRPHHRCLFFVQNVTVTPKTMLSTCFDIHASVACQLLMQKKWNDTASWKPETKQLMFVLGACTLHTHT